MTTTGTVLRLRLARPEDMPALSALMNAAISELLTPFLPPEGVKASFEIMGLDSQLIADGTYFVVEDGEAIAGCGGWSRRATLFGGDHSVGRDAAMLDPSRDAARVRAMYTHPAHTRKGVGRMVLDACERAAAAEGFSSVEMAATLGGVPLYRACDYHDIEPFTATTSTGYEVPLIRMGKALPAVAR
ncbi:MAG: GNAT family N-acetyltransferase [Caulobacter sp. 12-67-6]|nr:MAG: GNAT family N-acetyltransferase [Caulobacter sp. 12-67-6]OYX73892.1 MAG: GNAT family N-acetyltransferase [Caulobacter sp. 32-67-35]